MPPQYGPQVFENVLLNSGKTISLSPAKLLVETRLDPCTCKTFPFVILSTFLIFGSGRGRTPTQKPPGFLAAANVTSKDDQYFLRDAPYNGLDSIAFHYSIYRAFQRFLGMDGNLQVAYDISANFVSAWNEMFVDNDFINAFNGAIDPRHMYGTSNFDVFRWNSLNNGTQKSVLGTFIATLLMPGIPLVRVCPSLL